MAKVELKIGVQTAGIDKRLKKTHEAAKRLNSELEKLKTAEVHVNVRNVSRKFDRTITVFLGLMLIFCIMAIIQAFFHHRFPVWVNLILPCFMLCIFVYSLIKINRA